MTTENVFDTSIICFNYLCGLRQDLVKFFLSENIDIGKGFTDIVYTTICSHKSR